MTLSLMVMMLGLFLVPTLLLIAGHRLRRRSARVQSTFWSALFSHILASGIAIAFSMMPAELWEAGDFWRGAFGFWSLLVIPTIGGALGFMLGGTRAAR